MNYFFKNKKKNQDGDEGEDKQEKDKKENEEIQPCEANLREDKINEQVGDNAQDSNVGKTILKGIEYGLTVIRHE